MLDKPWKVSAPKVSQQSQILVSSYLIKMDKCRNSKTLDS